MKMYSWEFYGINEFLIKSRKIVKNYLVVKMDCYNYIDYLIPQISTTSNILGIAKTVLSVLSDAFKHTKKDLHLGT